MSNESLSQPKDDQSAHPSLVEMYHALQALARDNPGPIQAIDSREMRGKRARGVTRKDWLSELADAEQRAVDLGLQAAETGDAGAIEASAVANHDLELIRTENPDGPPKT